MLKIFNYIFRIHIYFTFLCHYTPVYFFYGILYDKIIILQSSLFIDLVKSYQLLQRFNVTVSKQILKLFFRKLNLLLVNL